MWEGVQEWVEEGLRESTSPSAIFALMFSAIIGGLAALRTRIWVAARKRTVGRTLLSFHDDDPLTVVFPVSERGKGGTKGTLPERELVNRGSLDTLVTLTRFIARLRYKNDLTVRAGDVETITSDLLLIGGDIKNDTSRYFIEKFNEAHPDLRIQRQDTGDTLEIRIGSGKTQRVFSRERLNTDPAGEKTRSINKDLVLLVAWKNPYLGTAAPRRGMMFAGFTGLGNNAAAQYLSKDLAQGHSKYRKRCRDYGLPHLYSSRWPMFLAVLEAEIHGRSVGEIKELHFEAIPE